MVPAQQFQFPECFLTDWAGYPNNPLLHIILGGGTVYDHSFCLLISAETSS